MSTTIMHTKVGKWLVTHNATWDGVAWLSMHDGEREDRVLTLPGEGMRALVGQMQANGADVEIDAPHPRLYQTFGDLAHWYGTDVDGKGWRWPRGDGGWDMRSEHPVDRYDDRFS